MAFKKFKTDRLFDGYRFREENTVLVTREDGTIEDIVSIAEAGDAVESLEGILLPGLINCHCHLELSHLKDLIPPHTGLIDFLSSVVTKRNFSKEIIQEKIILAEKEMYDNGTAAVGDIGNTADTAFIKKTSSIRWQNFVEVLGFTDEKAEANIQHYQKVADEMTRALNDSKIPHRTSLVPHAPYTVSPETFRMINAATKDQVISLHNQEHPAEDILYQTGGGDYLKFFKVFGIDHSPFPITGQSSIRSVLPYFNNGQTIFLVHNTFMSEEDIIWANEYACTNGLKLVYCICINANLYIENKVPPIDLFIKHNCHIVLGTDSYSSNWQLSIAHEIASIQKHFPQIAQELILQWATINGARALRWGDELGGFERGKKPGVVLIDPGFSSRRLF